MAGPRLLLDVLVEAYFETLAKLKEQPDSEHLSDDEKRRTAAEFAFDQGCVHPDLGPLCLAAAARAGGRDRLIDVLVRHLDEN